MDVGLSDMTAVAQVMLTAVGYAIGPIIISRHLGKIPPLGVVTASLIIAAALYCPFLMLVPVTAMSAAAGWSIVALGVICTALAFLLFFALVAEAGPARSTVITYINPAVAIVLGVLLLDEQLTIGMMIGFPLVIVGSILATSGQHEAARHVSGDVHVER